ncbi:MAG: NAD(P)-dependent oxidoreductase [bacterium]
MKFAWTESFMSEESLVRERWEGEGEILFFESPAHEIDLDDLGDEILLSIRTHTKLDDTSMDSVRAVISRSTGYDHLRGKSYDCPVGYLPEYATEAVADHVIGVSMYLLRKLGRARESMETFERQNLTGRELSGRTVGIVGAGNIGKRAAEMFSGIGSDVFAHDIEPAHDWARSHGISYVDLDELFQTCDLVVLTLPNTRDTGFLIKEGHLREMPSRSILVNAGRGEVVRNQALVGALKEGPVEAMALDVVNREQDLASHLRGETGYSESDELDHALELLNHSHVIMTPHNAFNTEEAVERKVQKTLDNFKYFLEEDRVLDPVPDQTK